MSQTLPPAVPATKQTSEPATTPEPATSPEPATMSATKSNEPVPSQEPDFSQQADEPQPSLAAEFLDFLVNNKAWWLTPIIVVLVLVGLLVVFASTAAGPFIYTLF